ncbi:MAG TPA: DNA polymerase/3'-5' exonuclease PolX [Anaerolineae bacterium]|nr:DNA polymerase/3'-5' exonuclease PolX [Anaerolineae bacterium]
MNNQDVARTFETLADMLDIEGQENKFKIIAYRRVAEQIANLDRDVNVLRRAGELRSIPGVGQAIEEKIDSLLRTGTFSLYERLQKEIPAGVVAMLAIPDLGPKRAKLLWKEAGITSVEELGKKARAGELAGLPGLGRKFEEKIVANIEAMRRRGASGRSPLGIAYPLARDMLRRLMAVAGVQRASVAGSLRRMRETIGDIDLLVSAEPADAEHIMDAFNALPNVAEVVARGPTKSSVRLHTGQQVDLRVIQPRHWGAALQYFTGSKDHNVRLREIALKKGYSLNEYSLTRVKDGKDFFCREEAEVYAKLGVPFMPPELREDRGEFEDELPNLIELSDLRGDLQMHTNWSDGQRSVEEMARAAKACGYEYILITDHSQSLAVTNGLSPERLKRQRAEIDRVNALNLGIRVLQGSEVEIKADGTLDYPDEILASLDIVLASLHTSLRQERDKVTRRALAAIRSPHVDIFAHPTGRMLYEGGTLEKGREGADLDMEAVLQAAAETGTIVEINADPQRLDLRDTHARRANELGCLFSINTDAHHPESLAQIHYGVAVARRAWIMAERVVNTWPLKRLRDYLAEGK